MKEVTLKLGLPETADEAQVLGSVVALQKENAGLKASLSATFVKLGEATGAITDDNRERMMKLADKDFDLALSFLVAPKKEDGNADPKPGVQKDPETLRLSDLLKAMKGNTTAPDSEKDYDWYQKNDHAALGDMRTKEPEKFQKLFDEFYNQKTV